MKHESRRKLAEQAALECIRVLKEEFGVKAAYVFGSLRGDSPWHSQSDIDIAVEGLELSQYWEALRTLDKLLPEGLNLDLVMLEGSRPELVVRAKGEFKLPEDNMEAMRSEIELELTNLERLVSKTESALKRYQQPPDEIEIGGIGKYVHDFYNSAERIFERIVIRLGSNLPVGEHWHITLLEQMEIEVHSQRPAVIDHELSLQLLKYLKFRHRFRHIYADELQWDKLHPLAIELSQTLETLREQISRFLDSIKKEGS